METADYEVYHTEKRKNLGKIEKELLEDLDGWRGFVVRRSCLVGKCESC
jgi:hypothetical protein